jgi:hypothetical protein
LAAWLLGCQAASFPNLEGFKEKINNVQYFKMKDRGTEVRRGMVYVCATDSFPTGFHVCTILSFL